MSKANTYDSSQIQALEGLEAVRKRPGMYIGTTSTRGLHHLVWEIVDNSIDEHLANYCDEITIKIHKDNSVTVRDNGRGIPIDLHEKFKIPAVEVVATILHAGGKFGGGAYKTSGGLHGVGASVVNALSEDMAIRVFKKGEVHEIRFSRGDTVQKLKVIGKMEKGQSTGTEVHFKPDPQIFKETISFDFKTIYSRMRESSFLNPGLTITVTDEREVDPDTETFVQETFEYKNGLIDYIAFLNQNKKPLHKEIFHVKEMSNDVEVDVAIQYTDSYHKDGVYSYVNNVKTGEGGTHETGLKSAITSSFKEYIQVNGLIKGTEMPLGEDMRVGMSAVISVKVPEVEFEGQTKSKLGNAEVRPIVDDVVKNALTKFLSEQPNEANAIVGKIVDSFEERMAARKARQERRKRKKSESSLGSLPDKLADCSSKKKSERELFLVEGDSAGGTAKQGRNRETQAIMPLRGKVLNVEKAKIEKINANAEIDMMRNVIGTDIDDFFDYDKLRYDKVIIMTDADVDGRHIQILLLTFFYRKMKVLIERGHVYLAQPPLYALKNSQGNKIYGYYYTEKELAEGRKEFPTAKIQRYKGLGEMDYKQLKDTTMDPNSRKLLRVTVEDAAEAENLLNMLMGDESGLRKEFIRKNVHKANVDA